MGERKNKEKSFKEKQKFETPYCLKAHLGNGQKIIDIFQGIANEIFSISPS